MARKLFGAAAKAAKKGKKKGGKKSSGKKLPAFLRKKK